MGIPYAPIRALEKKEPYLDEMNREPKKQADFLLKNNNMKWRYLGACLDSCRWGSLTTVMWEMDVKGMASFVQSWMQQNSEDFESLWHERKITELHTKFELPYTHYKHCPRDKKHEGKVVDLGGRVRCAHKTEKRFKPGFIEHYESFDGLSQAMRVNFWEDEPICNLPDDDIYDPKTGKLLPLYQKEYDEYLENKRRFDEENSTEIIDDYCYAILSDRKTILPLETIIRRLNLRPEFDTRYCVVPGYPYRSECIKVDELSKEEKEFYRLTTLCPGHKVPHNK